MDENLSQTDCREEKAGLEGAELEIIRASRLLGRVDRFIVEVHGRHLKKPLE